MKLVEAESTGPVEGEDAIVTPPRPPHRRVSVSLLFTLSVLVGTVVTIYEVFPARHNVLVTEALTVHQGPRTWDLVEPTAVELRAWALGVVGPGVPLPAPTLHATGARRIELLNRAAAVITFDIDGDVVTYLVQRARGIAPDHGERVDGELRAVEWQRGPFSCVGVGPERKSSSWLAALGGG